MQHLDEGTIHSWLDDALSADEAGRVGTHAKECPQCAAAVAEARGFIAASSRILTALDNAPRGVAPSSAQKKRVDPLVWRVAATVLVVAAGTLAVVRNRGSSERPASVSTEHAPMLPQPTSVSERVPAATGPAAASTDNAIPKGGVNSAPTIALSAKAGAEGTTVRTGRSAAASDFAGAAAPTAPTFAQSRGAGVVAMDAATEPEPLKVVGTPRRIGAKVTLYEVAPGDTVTLTESMPLDLDHVVVTGAAVAPMARQTTGKSAAAPAKARADAANALQTLSWTDSATGNTLTLTGRMPEARLREIKIRIDRERAAAAAKKNP